MNAAVGRVTLAELVAQWGPPAYERWDPATGLRLVQWVDEETTIYHSPRLPDTGGGPFTDGFARGVNRHRWSRVDVDRTVITAWFDGRDVLRRWARSDGTGGGQAREAIAPSDSQKGDPLDPACFQIGAGRRTACDQRKTARQRRSHRRPPRTP